MGRSKFQEMNAGKRSDTEHWASERWRKESERKTWMFSLGWQFLLSSCEPLLLCLWAAPTVQLHPAQVAAPGLAAAWRVFATAALSHGWTPLGVSVQLTANKFPVLGLDPPAHTVHKQPGPVDSSWPELVRAGLYYTPDASQTRHFHRWEFVDQERQAFSVVLSMLCKLGSCGVAIFCSPRK